MISPILEKIVTYYEGHTIVTADGYDAAILGVHEPSMRVIYDRDKCIEILMAKKRCDYITALAEFELKNEMRHVGDKMPLYVQTKFD